MERRRFLRGAGSAAAAGLATTVAGCTGVIGDDGAGSGRTGGDGTGDGGSDDDAGGGGEGQSIEDHPAARNVADQPRLGGPADDSDGDVAGNVILAFEDPSCPRCAKFERETVPRIESELVEPGDAAFVFRNYPVVYEWGEPATQALEATYARDETALWALLDHYYAEQDAFTIDNVLARTATYLDVETDLDGGAVAEDARAGTYDDAVQADLEAGMAADLGRTTPVVLLFRDGSYRTRASGSVSYELIANALGTA